MHMRLGIEDGMSLGNGALIIYECRRQASQCIERWTEMGTTLASALMNWPVTNGVYKTLRGAPAAHVRDASGSYRTSPGVCSIGAEGPLA